MVFKRDLDQPGGIEIYIPAIGRGFPTGKRVPLYTLFLSDPGAGNYNDGEWMECLLDDLASLGTKTHQ